MVIKRYIVNNMNEAMVKIRYELGSDAVIISQRRIRQNGFMGFFRHKKIEVTAAVDEKVKRNKAVISEKSVMNNDMHKEFSEIKSMIQGMLIDKNTDDNSKDKTLNKVDELRDNFMKKLFDNDVAKDIIDLFFERVEKKEKDENVSHTFYEDEFDSFVNEIIKTDFNNDERVQVLIGPTGVGKTTTIAKLASTYALYKNKKVGLITIDTYRIGAVEQLKTYAEILNVQIGVILSSKDIPEVMKKMEDCDIILIDTTGRNSKNIMQISETRKYVQEINPGKVHLVISMTTKHKDIKTILNNYRIVNYNSVILTKIDETDTFGSILTSAFYADAPISFITNGQNVPDDIQAADNNKLSKLILEDEK